MKAGFWRFGRKRGGDREAAWQAVAARLGLEDAAERANKLREFLDLGPETPVAPLYRTALELSSGPALLYLLEHAAPNGRDPHLTSAALLTTPVACFPFAFRALRKQHAVLERLTASASGGAAVPSGDPAFDARITVFARDPEAARAALTPPVRALLARALLEREVSPTLRLGERHLMLSVTAPATAPTPPETLETLATDLLTLAGVLETRSQKPEVRSQ